MTREQKLQTEIVRLREIMAALRDPDTGCPWDLEQNFKTIAPYTIEEAYEVADAIDTGDRDELRGELGDLLLQVIYHSRMAEEEGAFDLAEVVTGIADKMVARHPHVFGAKEVKDAASQTQAWEDMKAAERGSASALEGVARALPALMRAEKLQKRASRQGFDWPDTSGPREKILEELTELEDAGSDAERRHEAGDLLFSAVNLIRHMKIDPEVALRKANDRFEKRFRYVETQAATPLKAMSLDDLDALWAEAKQAEKHRTGER
jgi:ATP diphosphatase|tara:strand:- start:10102 stop:10893 length:792 start_codon:yes stop_codon:yes gene_type:complete